jgi:TonB family protein
MRKAIIEVLGTGLGLLALTGTSQAQIPQHPRLLSPDQSARPVQTGVPPGGPVPLGNPGSWVTTFDYPSEALRANAQGATGFRLTVDTEGRVTACQITSSSGSGTLDAATCNLVTSRAHFRPSTNARGKPVVGSFNSRLRWAIPISPPGGILTPPGAGVQVMSFIVEADGTRSHCAIERADGAAHDQAHVGPMPCEIMHFRVP